MLHSITSPDNRHLVSVSGNAVILWDQDVAVADPTRIFAMAPGSMISTFDWSPDGSLLFAGSRAGVIQAWSVANGKALFEQETGANAVRSIVYAEHTGRLAVLSDPGHLEIWDVLGNQLIERMSIFSLRQMGFSPLRFSWRKQLEGALLEWSPDEAVLYAGGVPIWFPGSGPFFFLASLNACEVLETEHRLALRHSA